MDDATGIPVILFPWKIIEYPIGDIDFDYRKPTCEEVIFSCLEELSRSLDLRQNPLTEEELTNLLPAFGLVRAENESVWLPPSHVFERTNEKQVYKIRMRHRPPKSNIFIENSLLSEFLVLQGLDDFLFGSVGKTIKVQRSTLLHLTALALLFPLSHQPPQPFENSRVIDETYRVENFSVWNYRKRFSKEIYKQLITTKSVLNRVIDRYHYHSAFIETFKKYKESRKKLIDYKITFLQLLLENYPQYCFEKYSAFWSDKEGCLLKVNITLNIYCELTDDSAPGIYIDTLDSDNSHQDVSSESTKIRVCGLEDISETLLKKYVDKGANHLKWQLEISTKSSPLNFYFEEKEMAISFITFLQGYMTLCIQPDNTLVHQFSGPFAKVRDNLKSFCSMSHSKACETLGKENFRKGETDQCGFLIYQSQKKLHDFYVATAKDEPVCVITCPDGKSFTLSSMSDCGNNITSYERVKDLRIMLVEKYGQQLLARRVAQTIDPNSVFYISKPVATNNEVEDVKDRESRPPAFVLEHDLKAYKRRFENSDKDSHLKRYVVEVGEEHRLQLELIPNNGCYMEALHDAVVTTIELNRNHPDKIMSCFGPVLTAKPPMSFLFEYSGFTDLISFLKRGGNTFSCQMKMHFALEVVKILCTLTEPSRGSGSVRLHGNLRGHNFWVFERKKTREVYYLKLGEPGLVHYYNTLKMGEPDNIRRLPWLSPERRSKNLTSVTEASEVYAAATTIAEIFHGTDDFQSIIGGDGGMETKTFFENGENKIPLPEFPESEEDAVVGSVKNVTRKLWEKLYECWDRDPLKRPTPQELKEDILLLLDETQEIPQETQLGDMRAQIADMYQVATNNLSMKECYLVIKSRNKYFIDPREIHIDKTKALGRGKFGIVYKGTKNGTTVAVKKANEDVSSGIQKEINKDLLKEVDLGASLEHPNIVKFLNFSMDQGSVFIVLEFMNLGSLKAYAQKNGNMLTAEEPKRMQCIKTFLNFSLDIAKGMAFLEKYNVAHCDLAARNVLLQRICSTSPIIAKVADFGLAKAIKKGKDYYYVKTEEMPLCWYPPEYLLVERYGQLSRGINFTTTGDIWSFGTTLWELFTKGKSPSQLVREMSRGHDDIVKFLFEFFMTKKQRWPKEDFIDQDIYNVMMACWKEDPLQRPKFSELKIMIEKLLSDRS